jgi:hypothetical protein
MQKIISIIISAIFHPIFMPLIGVFILFNSNSYVSLLPIVEKKFIYYIVIGCTIVLPLLVIPFFLFNNYINNLNLDKKEERKLPYFITLCFNYFAYYILKKIAVPEIIETFILSCFISITFTLLISLKFKISAHMVGIGGLTGLIFILSFSQLLNAQYFFMIVFIASGLIGYSRLYLNAHNSLQVYSGYFSGLIIVLATFSIMS